MNKDNLGDRMKMYEQSKAGERLMPLLPICVRLDGKNFSKFTKSFKRPFDERFHAAMQFVTQRMVKESGAIVGYTQSDEISLILYKPNIDSQVFFDGKLQKIVSVLSSMATLFFQEALEIYLPEIKNKFALFDCRAWSVPTKEEAINTLVWREIDATKNSVSMAARCYFSHKELHKMGRSDMQDMLFSKNINWNDYPAEFKRGSYFMKTTTFKEFTDKELSDLPEKHAARLNPSLKISRSDITKIDLPPIQKIKNRVAFFFDGEDLIVSND
jgi:tRNA(His) 5'-end guanylyltransferase